MGRGGFKIVILFTSTSTQIPNHKTSKNKKQKKHDISKQYSNQAVRQGKLRKITKCLLTWFSQLQVDFIPIENERLTCCLKNMPFFKKIIGEE